MYFSGIEAFLMISQTENITKAAELLHLSQSTISYRLKMLEEELGCTLVERGKGIHKIRLTAKGESFLVIAERWKELWRETKTFQSSEPQLSLSVSAADSLNLYVLPPLYQALSEHYCPIRLNIRTHHTIEAFESIERREMDVAFVVKAKESPNVTVRPFFSEEMVVIRLAENKGHNDGIIDILALQPEYELYINWSTHFQAWHDQIWESVSPFRIRLDTAGLITALMKNSNQWAIVPLSIAKIMAQSGQFIIGRTSVQAPERICYMVTHMYPSKAILKSLAIVQHYVESLFKR